MRYFREDTFEELTKAEYSTLVADGVKCFIISGDLNELYKDFIRAFFTTIKKDARFPAGQITQTQADYIKIANSFYTEFTNSLNLVNQNITNLEIKDSQIDNSINKIHVRLDSEQDRVHLLQQNLFTANDKETVLRHDGQIEDLNGIVSQTIEWNKRIPVIQDHQPDPNEYLIWINTVNNKMYYWNGSIFTQVSN